MAEIGLAASIIAVIQIAASVTTQAYNYGVKFKNAKEDLDEVNRELGHVAQVLDRLKALAEEVERSGKALHTLPALAGLRSDDGPLAKCNQALLDLRTELTSPDSLGVRLSQRAKWARKRGKVMKSLQTIERQKCGFLELLRVDHMSQTIKTGKIISGMSNVQISEKSTHLPQPSSPVAQALTDSNLEEAKSNIIKWIAPIDPRTNQEAARKKHEEETGKWFTESERFSNWLEQPNSLLWLHGIPGSGKTILCSEIIEQTNEYCQTGDENQLAYFFFSFRDTEKQKASNLPRSILAQLLKQNDNIPTAIQTFYEEYKHGVPSESGVLNSIRDLITSETYIIIDALDECPNYRRRASGIIRKEADLLESLGPIVTQEPISIQGSLVNTDIRKFVRTQLQVDPRLSKLSGELQAEIEQVLVKKSGGMFRWVVCQFHSLSKCLSPTDIRSALSSLPRTLDETYERILVNIPIEYQTRAINALRWIIYSLGAIKLDALADAIIINHDADPPFNLGDRLSDPSRLLEILPGLITTEELRYGQNFVQIAHFSVVEYLQSARIVDGPANVFHLEESKAIISITKGCFDILKSYAHPINQKLLGDNARAFSPLEWHTWHFWTSYVELLDTPIDLETSRLVVDFAVNIDSIQQRHHYKLEPTDMTRVFSIKNSGRPLDHALYVAADGNLLNLVKLLLNAGADVEFHGGPYGTALQRAALFSNLEMIKFLLDSGADINSTAGERGTALQIAAYHGNLATIKFLLDAGSDVNLQGGGMDTALQLATDRGRLKMVKLLVNKGADVNSRGGKGTALQIAAYRGNLAIIKFLLDAGSDVNLQGGGMDTALQLATDRGQLEIVKLLLDTGADVNRGCGVSNALETVR